MNFVFSVVESVKTWGITTVKQINTVNPENNTQPSHLFHIHTHFVTDALRFRVHTALRVPVRARTVKLCMQGNAPVEWGRGGDLGVHINFVLICFIWL